MNFFFSLYSQVILDLYLTLSSLEADIDLLFSFEPDFCGLSFVSVYFTVFLKYPICRDEGSDKTQQCCVLEV
jgi:hypothetical protein